MKKYTFYSVAMFSAGMISAVLILLALTFFMTSCSSEAIYDDGSGAAERLSQGYTQMEIETSDKLWKNYAPYCGVQVWGASEGWGQAPDIDLKEGTISAVMADKAMFVVLGAFDETGATLIGSYDCSAIRKIEFDIKASKSGSNMTFASYVSGAEIKHEENVSLSDTFENKSFSIPQGGRNVDYLFYFNLAAPEVGYTVTINNIAFYDAAGNQLKTIPLEE